MTIDIQLQVISYKLQVTLNKLQVTLNKLVPLQPKQPGDHWYQVTSYQLQVTSVIYK